MVTSGLIRVRDPESGLEVVIAHNRCRRPATRVLVTVAVGDLARTERMGLGDLLRGLGVTAEECRRALEEGT